MKRVWVTSIYDITGPDEWDQFSLVYPENESQDYVNRGSKEKWTAIAGDPQATQHMRQCALKVLAYIKERET